MTHDELLARLWILPANVTELQHGAKAVHALRAVVELHKPFQVNDVLLCECEPIIYPCPTIQVIEKELNT